MFKRVMFGAVGAGIGALIGLVIDVLGAGHWAIVASAVAGSTAPLWMGPPGK